MAKKENGAGNIRKRKDGTWEARYSVGIDPGTGKSTPTMRRMIAKYATDEAAKAENNGDRNTARNLRMIAQSGAEDGRSFLMGFDTMSDTFNRTLRNHSMIPHWEQLTAPIIDTF